MHQGVVVIAIALPSLTHPLGRPAPALRYLAGEMPSIAVGVDEEWPASQGVPTVRVPVAVVVLRSEAVLGHAGMHVRVVIIAVSAPEGLIHPFGANQAPHVLIVPMTVPVPVGVIVRAGGSRVRP